MKAILVIAAFAVCLPQMAQAQGCTTEPDIHTTLEQAIHLCTAAMHSRSSVTLYSGTINAPTAEQKAGMYYARGLLYMQAGKNDLAIADFDSALGWTPNDPDIHAAQGDAYMALGQHDKAAADYAFVDAHPLNSPEELNARCWARAVRGWPLDKAIADCTDALKIDPSDARILDSRCFAEYRAGQYQPAIADCDAAVKINPRMASSLYVRGLAKLKAGDTAGGDADIAAAKDADYRIAEEYAVYGVKP